MRIWKNEAEKTAENEDQKVVSFEKPQMEGEPLGNKIYFYTDISKDTILTLNKQIDVVSKQMKIVQLTYDLPTPPPIEIHICSDGGDVFASLAQKIDFYRSLFSPRGLPSVGCEGNVCIKSA